MNISLKNFDITVQQKFNQHNITLDWSREGILEREEMWLRSQSNNLRLNDHHHHNRNNNNTTLRLTRRYNRYDETNVAFIKGFSESMFISTLPIKLITAIFLFLQE